MQIKEIHTLLEGLRFGQSEISELQQESNRIFIGWEFEWKLDEEYREGDGAGSEDELFDRIQEIVQREVEQIKKDIWNDLYQQADEEMVAETLIQICVPLQKIYDFVGGTSQVANAEMYSAEELEQLNQYVIELDRPISMLDDVKENMEETFQTFDFPTPKREEVDNDDIESLYDELTDALTEITDLEDGENQEFLDHLINMIDVAESYLATDLFTSGMIDTSTTGVSNSFFQTLDKKLTDRAREWATDTADEIFDETWDISQIESEAREQAEDEGYGHSSESVVEAMKEILRETGMYPDPIDRVLEDGSVPEDEGAEAVSRPEPMNESFATLSGMFDIIKSYGYTDTDTGLHMNVSFQGEDLNMDRPFNHLKFMLLMDEPYMRRYFPERGNVADVVRSSGRAVRIDALSNLFTQLAFPGDQIDAMEENFNKYFLARIKHTGVNILPLDLRDMDQRRIEFRYMGGENYEKRLDDIKFHAYRLIYMMKVGFDDDFATNEYAKKLLRAWDMISEDITGMSFNHARNIIVPKARDYLDGRMNFDQVRAELATFLRGM